MDEQNPLPDFINPKQYPDFWEQMKNFKEFAQSVGQSVAEGNGLLVSEEKRLKRETVCMGCSQFNKESKRCYICGCFMEHKMKFKASECPLSKW
jgi:hypothetical protein